MSAATTPPAAGLRSSLPSLGALTAKRDWIGGTAAVILVVVVLLAIFGPLIAPHDTQQQDLLNRLTPPVWRADGTWAYPFGTDQLGRDVLSRLIVGTRLTLLIAVAAAGVELLIGATLGIIAGFKGGRIQSVIMRWTDIQMSFPALLVVLLIIILLGSGPTTLILALGLNGWMVFTRVMNAEVRRLRYEPYVESAQLTGMSTFGLLRRHILPQVRGRLLAVYLMEVPRMMLAESGLSFLGFGINPPQLSWGLMIGESRSLIAVAPWPSLIPGLAIVITVMAMYLFASWLEPRVDPLRRRRVEA